MSKYRLVQPVRDGDWCALKRSDETFCGARPGSVSFALGLPTCPNCLQALPLPVTLAELILQLQADVLKLENDMADLQASLRLLRHLRP